MKFRSRDGKTKRIEFHDGRVWLVGTEWKFLPDIVHSEAYAVGCVSEDMVKAAQNMTLPTDEIPAGTGPAPDAGETETQEPPVGPENREPVILEKMKAMVASGDEGTMTAKGLPNKKTLTDHCGFAPTPAEFTKAWAIILSEQ